MNFNTLKINSREKRGINTEILFNIATARNSGTALIRLDVVKEAGDSVFKAMLTSLRNAKKKNLIDTYVSIEDIKGNGTAAIYLLNKFPELQSAVALDNFYSLFVKI